MTNERYCLCDETLRVIERDHEGEPVSPVTIREPKHQLHDCNYVRYRNALVATAEAYATSKVPEALLDGASIESGQAWNKYFAAEMSRLTGGR